ncbi:hypothetical protein LCGC14_0996180 [marine sediment metagenome]|uniref:ATPase n=1 Tax=marine sediment metagenome TaxID=412755 RepID=A0A0F9QMU2_9ZZZZ|nr:ATPase [Methylophaga sp.]HEC59307.1 ATPase [Methylophaga sp.]
MQVETLKDLLNWTVDFHHQLSGSLADSAGENDNERAKLLLNYLAEHEQNVCKIIKEFLTNANSNALNTWCYEYLNKHSIIKHTHADAPFADFDTAKINEAVTHLHQQVITLYEDLLAQIPANSAHELLEEVFSLEQHEAMRISQSANRLEDM